MVTVTRKFRDDFETWAADRVAKGEFTLEEMAEFQALLRLDLTAGPDHLRVDLMISTAAGVSTPAAIHDLATRYRLWADFFAAESEAIRLQQAGNART